VRPQTSKCGRDRRALQTDDRDIVEINGVRRDAVSRHLALMLSLYRLWPKPAP
jgi:hypothetical protein